ncbi:beta-propeller repeat protein [Leptospira weilii serovar Ranarum str. ICFT]|uniref:Beta-propeller repeat protein n=1 Tax=Leptospira weilii serovar Ranarum str. ICFT TaxID=1218598 RepID=N1WQC6_9LEPT|nr:SBBP repeat-containing protein [Leptospira weilii]EMY79452.1 beta-propeller repeat protein [Leptospira weilii serovar Ranarum str. ICFT]
MIRFLILLFILFLQACSPTSDTKTNNNSWTFFLFRESGDSGFRENESENESLDLFVNQDSIQFHENLGNLDWTLMVGSPTVLTMRSRLAIDRSGSIYVAADIGVDIDGNPLHYEPQDNPVRGIRDLILGKYDSQKKTIWTKQVGAPGAELKVTGIAVDWNENTYVTGSIVGAFEGVSLGVKKDLFLVKFAPDGNVMWKKQTGPNGGNYEVSPEKIAIDTFGNSYIVGTSDGPFGGDEKKRGNGFIVKFDTDGNRIWVKQLAIQDGTISPMGVVFDKVTGSVYMAGYGNVNFETNSSPGIGYNNFFILKYDADGNGRFFTQLGVPKKRMGAYSVAVDLFGNVFAAGPSDAIFGSETVGNSFLGTLVKYDSSGVRQWVSQFGPFVGRKNTVIQAMATDKVGNVFTTGWSNGSILDEGKHSIGSADVFLTKHNPSGQNEWKRQMGTAGSLMSGNGVEIDLEGNLYCTGWTTGALNGVPVTGNRDLFLMKFK